jgi:multiple antibiotic resistance protein
VIELFTTAFITLLVIVDPPGCAPIFASLTSGTDAKHRRRMAIRSALVAWGILLFFALLGEPLLSHMGISLSAFRLAGGIMLFIIALEMVFEKRTERREERAREIEGTPEAEDISVFPMAIPMIAGPGSIASVMLLNARADGLAASLVVLGAMTLVIFAARRRAADALRWRQGRGDDHPDPRRDPGGTGRAVRTRRTGAEPPRPR